MIVQRAVGRSGVKTPAHCARSNHILEGVLENARAGMINAEGVVAGRAMDILAMEKVLRWATRREQETRAVLEAMMRSKRYAESEQDRSWV
jgi:hypothetical protein